MATSPKSKKAAPKRAKRVTNPLGRAYIQSTMNNTIVTITDAEGNTISWGTTGAAGFKGSRKSTPYAGQMAAAEAATKAVDRGLAEVHVFLKGIGAGRESALRALKAEGLGVRSIADITPIPHNGCRPKKARRV